MSFLIGGFIGLVLGIAISRIYNWYVDDGISAHFSNIKFEIRDE